jgi:predicted membrane metal-binding protein
VNEIAAPGVIESTGTDTAPFGESVMMPIPYGLIALIVFWILVVRLWRRAGPRIPLVFVGLWVAGYFVLPLLSVWIPFQLFTCGLAIVMAVIDRVNPATLRNQSV